MADGESTVTPSNDQNEERPKSSTSAAVKKASYNKGDRRKLPPITRDLHTAHHDPVRKTLVVRRSRTAQDRRQFFSPSTVGLEDDDQDVNDDEEDLERPDTKTLYNDDDEEIIAEVPDSVLVDSQKVSTRGKPGAVGADAREVNIFDDSGFDTDLEAELKPDHEIDEAEGDGGEESL